MVFYTVRRRFESCQGHQVFSPDPFGEYVPCCVELVSQDGVSERNPIGIHQPTKQTTQKHPFLCGEGCLGRGNSLLLRRGNFSPAIGLGKLR